MFRCCLILALSPLPYAPAIGAPDSPAEQQSPEKAPPPPPQQQPAPPSSIQRSQVAYSQALAYFDQGDFVNAEGKFLEAGEALNTSQSINSAAFNIALTALHAGDDKTFAQYQGQLNDSGNSELVGELLLEQGLFLASHSVTQSFEALLHFLAKYPSHPRVADARLTLAELYLNEIPAKPVSAREQLESARGLELSPRQRESLDYIAVWIEKSDGNYSAVIDQALRFLDHWPQAHRSPDIQMKLGQAYYRERDFSRAVNTFEQLAAAHPESRLAGPALFSAGRAASLSRNPEDRERAIELWSRLAGNDSDPLAPYARHEQGLFKLKREELDEAISIFDSILSHDPPPPLDLKLAVLADRGQAMFSVATARDNNSDHLKNAVQSFDAILNEPDTPASWRNQAAVRKAKCLERLGRRDEALATYTDVVRSDRLTEGTNTDAPVAQVEWFFRAGLGAIRLLQEKKQWSDAIQVADSLANSGSPRAIEAARLADRIRLQHFIWDQPER
jgi:tetratricopeptide (TPR) repeat protein